MHAHAAQIRRFLKHELWSEEPASRWIVTRAVRLLQFAILTAEGFVKDRLLLHASALTYFTLVSLIPVFAVAVSIAAAIGVESDFAEALVAKLAAGAPALQASIVAQIRAADFKALGGIGAAITFVLTVLGISNVEAAFNAIWGVTKRRSWSRRFPDYLAILVMIPILATALSLATGLRSEWLMSRLLEHELFARVYELGLGYLPWLTLTGSLALLFWFLPNTSVRFSSALLGGAIAAMLVLRAQDIYLTQSVGAARANALYGAFAQLPLLFVWIYVFWAIVLFGAELAFAHQNLASYRRELHGAATPPAEREALALRGALLVARAFDASGEPETLESLTAKLDAPIRVVRDVLGQLEAAQILSRRGGSGEEGALQLAQPSSKIRVLDVLAALRGTREAVEGDAGALAVEKLLAGLDARAAHGEGSLTLAELLAAQPSLDPPATRS
ncbi:MAG TPA: YhjD/YihY/BrkB family envelope integrity protein [Myxococcota bacterium]|nr:YhjD/YihY/BrkB family envelope integrity protein [Myxococcota bacterium]